MPARLTGKVLASTQAERFIDSLYEAGEDVATNGFPHKNLVDGRLAETGFSD